MTRKRFVKLCMARGYSRNEANELAREGVAIYGSYSALFVVTLLGSSEFYEAFSEAVRIAANIVQEVCDKLTEPTDEIGKIKESVLE